MNKNDLLDMLDEYGELNIRLDSGEDRELHKHNVEEADNGMIKVDADDEIHWFDATKVERVWIHKDF